MKYRVVVNSIPGSSLRNVVVCLLGPEKPLELRPYSEVTQKAERIILRGLQRSGVPLELFYR